MLTFITPVNMLTLIQILSKTRILVSSNFDEFRALMTAATATLIVSNQTFRIRSHTS